MCHLITNTSLSVTGVCMSASSHCRREATRCGCTCSLPGKDRLQPVTGVHCRALAPGTPATADQYVTWFAAGHWHAKTLVREATGVCCSALAFRPPCTLLTSYWGPLQGTGTPTRVALQSAATVVDSSGVVRRAVLGDYASNTLTTNQVGSRGRPFRVHGALLFCIPHHQDQQNLGPILLLGNLEQLWVVPARHNYCHFKASLPAQLP